MATTWVPEPLVSAFLAECQQEYEAGDVWRAWEAYAVASTYGQAIPAWVVAYLAATADALTALHRDPRPRKDDRLAAAVTRALRLTPKGRGTLVTRRHQAEKATALATDVALLVADGHTEYLAIEHVAKFHRLGTTTVREAYKAARARREALDGVSYVQLLRTMVVTQGYQPGSRIEGCSYPTEPRRAWTIEALEPGETEDVMRARLRLEPPPA
jgi:hypothetical protein